ncbi:MAG: hypothetical protein LC121_25870 [Anaerolineae bacterium]|nr:hypothetical protein [Anaerolineae bacterium]
MDGELRERLVRELTASPGYRLSEDDTEFLDQPTARPARLLLEMMRPEFYLQRHGINSTVVVFGSARVLEPAQAQRELCAAEAAVAAAPGDAASLAALREARLRVRYAVYYDEARARRARSRICRGECRASWSSPVVGRASWSGQPRAWEAGERRSASIDLPRSSVPTLHLTEPRVPIRTSPRKMHFPLRARRS